MSFSCENCVKQGHKCPAAEDQVLCDYCLKKQPCPHVAEPLMRHCDFPECGAQLNANNKSGRCYTHHGKEANGKQAERSRNAKRVPEVAPAILEPLTLTITEAMLNQLLLRLPVEQKLEIVQKNLARLA